MPVGSTLYYVLKDHLGSASVVTDATGVTVGEQRYYPFGETRLTIGTIYTDKLFTGQREMAGLGIYHYKARFYSAKLGRFLSPDSLVPSPVTPQAFNRYSYVMGNPLRYVDPTGHRCEPGDYEPGGYCYSPLQPSNPPPGIDQEHDRKLRRLRTQAELLSARMKEGTISDLDALEMLFDYTATAYGDDVDGALTDLGIVVGGLDTTGSIPRQIDVNNPLNQYYVRPSAFNPEQTGFSQDLNPNNENQVRHFLAGVAGSNAAGGAGQLFMYRDELSDILGRRGGSTQDLVLYARAFEFVRFLNGNPVVPSSGHPLSEAGPWVQEHLGP